MYRNRLEKSFLLCAVNSALNLVYNELKSVCKIGEL